MQKIFYAMPFTGSTYEEIVKKRTDITVLLSQHGMHLLEQFIGVENKEDYICATHDPAWIVQKDKQLIAQSDIVFVDFSGPSVGRDGELILAKEIFRKYVIAIVPNSRQQIHPWIRHYSDKVVSNIHQAIEHAKLLNISQTI